MFDYTWKFTDILIIFATIIGPILAVQAQKAIERFTDDRSRKEKIFYAIMSTRMSRLNIDHILALNSIPLVFGNSVFLNRRRTSRSEQRVLEAWDSYQDVLNTRVAELTEPHFTNWVQRRDDEFNNLLLKMSESLGFHFNKLQITKGAYAPIAQANLEKNQQDIVEGLAKLFRNEYSLPLTINSISQDEDAVALQKKTQEALFQALIVNGVPIKLMHSNKSRGDSDDR